MDEQHINDPTSYSSDIFSKHNSSIAPLSRPHSILEPDHYGTIPHFPDIRPLVIADQFTIERWARRFPPVSDFNFVSLWSWNTDGGIEVSWLNGNLVVLFKDYLSDDRFFSFLGTNDVSDTAQTLLDTARQQGLEPKLQLIPGVVIAALPAGQQDFQIDQDDSQKDYILSTEEWSHLAGGKFRKKRNAIHALERSWEPVCRLFDIGQSDQQQAIQAVFGRWIVQSNRAGNHDVVLQATALQRIFSLQRPGDLHAMGVFLNGELRAFTINEPLHNDYALGHFCYGDHAVPGLYSYVLRETCRSLRGMGFHFLNTMQDLGQAGMMQAKIRTRPHHYLYKYSLKRASDSRQAVGGAVTDDLVVQPPTDRRSLDQR